MSSSDNIPPGVPFGQPEGPAESAREEIGSSKDAKAQSVAGRTLSPASSRSASPTRVPTRPMPAAAESPPKAAAKEMVGKVREEQLMRELRSLTNDEHYKALIEQALMVYPNVPDEDRNEFFIILKFAIDQAIKLFPKLDNEKKVVVLGALGKIPADQRSEITKLSDTIEQLKIENGGDVLLQFLSLTPPGEKIAERLKAVATALENFHPKRRERVLEMASKLLNDLQTCKTEEVIALINHLGLLNPEEADSRVEGTRTLLSSSNSHFTLSDRVAILKTISSIPQTMRDSILRRMLPIWNLLPTPDVENRIRLFQLCARMCYQEMEIERLEDTMDGFGLRTELTPFLTQVLPLTNNCDDRELILDILQSAARIYPESRNQNMQRFSPWLARTSANTLLDMFDAMWGRGMELGRSETVLNEIFEFLQAHPNDVEQVVDRFIRPAQTTFSSQLSEPRTENRIILKREELKTIPEQLLSTLVEQWQTSADLSLRVDFADEHGQDASGLSRDFITGIFEGIKIKMQFKELENGLYAPQLMEREGKYVPLSSADIKVYGQLGQLMMFCLNVPDQPYPSGMIFDERVFIALTKLKAEHLDRELDALLAEPESFNELFDIYAAMMRLSVAEKESASAYLSGASTEEREATISSRLAPIIEMARGMRAAPHQLHLSWEGLTQMVPGEISKMLQGTVSPEMIVENLRFGAGIAEKQQKWIKKWILDADEEKMEKFLYAMTGAKAMGKKGLEIKKTTGLPQLHTCFNQLELPLSDTKAALWATLDRAIEGEGYDMA